MKRYLALLIVILVVTATTFTIFTTTSYTKTKSAPPFCVGEEVIFKIYINNTVYGGTQKMEVLSKKKYDGKMCYYVKADTESNKVIKEEYDYYLHDVMYAYIDAKTFLPYKVVKSIEEGNYKDKVTITFDHENRTGKYKSKTKGVTKDFSWKSSNGDLLDVLSMVFYVRAKRLKAGDKLNFQYLDEKSYTAKKVKISSKKGKKVNDGELSTIKLTGTLSEKHDDGTVKQVDNFIQLTLASDDDEDLIEYVPWNISLGLFKVAGFNIKVTGYISKDTDEDGYWTGYYPGDCDD